MLIYSHGDIANNICLKQECNVLEIVGCKKEYLIKRMAKISKKLRCPIFIVMGIDISKKYNTEERKCNYIDKGYINNVDKINKYVDNFIIINGTEQYNIIDEYIDILKIEDTSNKDTIISKLVGVKKCTGE